MNPPNVNIKTTKGDASWASKSKRHRQLKVTTPPITCVTIVLDSYYLTSAKPILMKLP